MRRWMIATGLLTALAVPASAGEIGDQLAQRLYDGTLGEIAQEAGELCAAEDSDACFALGMLDLVTAYEGFSQALYRHGAVAPSTSAVAVVLGMGGADGPPVPANPDPEPLTYDKLRDLLEDFSQGLASASAYFEQAGNGGEFSILIDPLKVRLDFDGDGVVDEHETLNELNLFFNEAAMPGASYFDVEPPKTKIKHAPDTTVGFDNADAIWLAGYSRLTRAPVELLLAHDFSDFYDAYMHRIFPKAGLPMEDHSRGGALFGDPESDTVFADMVVAVHEASFPVQDRDRLMGVHAMLKQAVGLSRRNWELILAETDDSRELVPSPSQTSIVPGMSVSQETVDAWLATLDRIDEVLDGELLVPHWRFEQGIDLKAWFAGATETDLVMMIAGQAFLPFIKQGPVADAESFAEANDAFGADWLNYAIWFN